MTTPSHRKAERRIVHMLIICLSLTLLVNLSSFWHVNNQQTHQFAEFRKRHLLVKPSWKNGPKNQAKAPKHKPSAIAGLSCEKWGGPYDHDGDFDLQEMVYWRDMPQDDEFVSPYLSKSSGNNNTTKYLIFDVDGAGWNNKRISFENFILMAWAMGRTLVLPPKQIWWGFTEGAKKNKDPPRHGFEDFFDLDAIEKEHAGINFISMQDFLEQHAGQLRDQKTLKVVYPPKNRTDWNHNTMYKPLKDYLGRVLPLLTWRCEDCILGFPSNGKSTRELETVHSQIIKEGVPEALNWIGKPTFVNGSVHDRMQEMTTDREELCLYTPEMQEQEILYFMTQYDATNERMKTQENVRLLIWFYSFLFFQDWKQDLWAKRFVRDHLRYKDEVQCAAARVVKAVRERSRERNVMKNGEFDALHIRRLGEFETQYGDLTSAKGVYHIAKQDLIEGGTVYVATDDSNRTYFEPLMKHYDIVFLQDFQHLLKGINPNYLSLVDQLVVTRGRKFFGAWMSTYTGYINRLRGYHSTKDKLKGYENGIVESYFYNRKDKRDKMKSYHPPVGPFWYFREFPLAWRDVDHDVA